MRRHTQLLAAAAASLALITTPVMARDHWGRGRDWDRHYDRDNGVSAGDVIAGVAVLGAIAAIAGVFDGRQRENEPVPVRYPEQDTRGYGAEYGSQAGGSGLDRAVDICVAELEATGTNVVGVDGANRTGDGWFVSGAVDGGAPFSCRIGNDGRVSDVQVGDAGQPADDGYYGAAAPIDGQYDDATYIRARGDLGDGRSYSAR
ncbi:hypothetical protein V5740_07480 [Croceibacterium sp. TMG7-5b_MA50]|uniref:hypothetical protein n=1 Tax=Croceibacterium sp. TMG7-5b_MA50 TaxID=3121290 RepID=UPI0032219F1B